MRFGVLLRQYRHAAGMSLDDLATAVNYSRSYLSRVENGKRGANQVLAGDCDTVLGAGGALIARMSADRDEPLTERWSLTMSASGGAKFTAGHGELALDITDDQFP